MEVDAPDLTFQPELIGREEEFKKLVERFERAKKGNGSTIFIAGEAGVGKTRLVNEFLDFAEDEETKIIKSRCWTESIEPLKPIKDGLRDTDLYHLISDEPPPKVLAAYLINDDGILVSKAKRKNADEDIDHDIFSSMLKVVKEFVKDSLSMMGREETGELNSIGYGDYNILIQSLEGISLATVIEGGKNEFLIDDMKEKLSGKPDELEDWNGDMSEVENIESELQWFIDSGKYDGEFLVEDPEIKQENIFDNVLLGLQRLSSEQPVVLFIDDLQWADPTSLKLIHYLSRNTKDDKILILGAYRSKDMVSKPEGETYQLKPALQEMKREDLFDHILLERLEKSDVERLIEKTLGEMGLEERMVNDIYQECEGNPFFLLELLRKLVEEGHLVKKENKWKVKKTFKEVQIPEKVYDLVVRRLDRLTEEQRKLLETASIVGEEFKSDVLVNLTGMDRVKLLKNLNEIERSYDLVRSINKKYRFDHSKIRDVLYNGMNEELRCEYHRMIAETYEELYTDEEESMLDQVGRHFYKANDERAGKYLMKAGVLAKEKYANEEAEKLYRYSIDVLEEREKLKEAYESLGDVHNLMGKYDQALDEYESALELVESTVEEADLHSKIAKIYEEQGEFDKSLKICENSLEKIRKDIEESSVTEEKIRLLGVKGWAFLRKGEYDKAEKAWREGIKIAEEFGDDKEIAQTRHDIATINFRRGAYDKALELLEEALQIRRGLEDEKTLASSLNNIGVVCQNKGDLDKSLEHFEESLEISRKIGDKRGISMSLNNIGMVYRDKGKLDSSLEHYKKSLEIDKKLGDKSGIGRSHNNIGELYRDKGDLDKSLEHLEKGLKIKKKLGDKRGIVMTLNNIGAVYSDKGELEKSLERHEESLEISKEIGDKRGVADSLNYIAKMYRYKGKIEKAQKHIEESLDICSEIGSKRLYIENLCELAKAHLEKGRYDNAFQKAEKAIELATKMDTKPERGRTRGVLGIVYREKRELEKAKKEFREAEKLLENSGLKIDLEKVRYEHALLFVRLGEVEKAEESLNEAFESFKKRDMKLWAEKCEEALKDLDDY